MSQPADILIIGYGNELRRDDGVGPRVAEAVAAWRRPGLRTLVCHQLAPELAEVIAQARAVIFVDAALSSGESTVQARPVEPLPTRSALAHAGEPRGLLALARDVFGQCPPAWVIAVPALDFGFGEQLSPLAAAGVPRALERIRCLCGAL